MAYKNQVPGAGTTYQIIGKSQFSGKIADLYNGLAPVYDFFTDHEIKHHKMAIQMAHICSDDLVLEVACGTGRATAEIADIIGRNNKLYAVDLTPGMMDRARKRLLKRNLLDKVDLKIANARDLPFPSDMFDVIYNSYMFDLIDLEEIPRILAEFKRVLKPGGKLILVNMSKRKKGLTLYETLYEKGILGSTSGSCRPVYLDYFLKDAGFEVIERVYADNHSWFFLNWLTGTEIVIALENL